MSLVTYNGLVKLVEGGILEGVDPENINAASIDITLGDVILVEDWRHGTVDLAKKESIYTERVVIPDEGFILPPGKFILAHSVEKFYLPDDIACEYKLKSTLARNGLNHMLAGWCDPGWNGSVLTLEFQNVTSNHELRLRKGMKIGQMVFFRGERVPSEASYAQRGQYNGDTSVAAGKVVR